MVLPGFTWVFKGLEYQNSTNFLEPNDETTNIALLQVHLALRSLSRMPQVLGNAAGVVVFVHVPQPKIQS
jgi:hypothetical protein